MNYPPTFWKLNHKIYKLITVKVVSPITIPNYNHFCTTNHDISYSSLYTYPETILHSQYHKCGVSSDHLLNVKDNMKIVPLFIQYNETRGLIKVARGGASA